MNAHKHSKVAVAKEVSHEEEPEEGSNLKLVSLRVTPELYARIESVRVAQNRPTITNTVLHLLLNSSELPPSLQTELEYDAAV